MQEQKFYNLTNPQKSIWVTEEYFKGSAINNICGTALIKEKVDLKLLEKSIIQVLNNNDIFKIKFCLNEGKVEQYVSDYVNSDIIYLHAKNLKEFEELKNEIVARPFHLLNSHPYNFYIIQFPNGHAAFSLNIHHILADSWTLGFLSKQIVKTYCALLQIDIPYKCETYSYVDYIKSEKNYKESSRLLKDKNYWNKEFETIPELPFLPGSIKDTKHEETISAKRLQYSLNNKLVNKIKRYCEENHISLYNFFMAIYSIYIHDISGLDDFVIGTPILNRTNVKEKLTAGMFINMAALRMDFSDCPSFHDLLKLVSSKSRDMLKHQKYSYQSLLEDLRETHGNIPTLYNTVFSYQITNTQSEEIFVEYTSDWTFNGNSSENMTIQVFDLDDSGELNITYDYKTSIYSEEDITAIHERILHLISQILSAKNIYLKDLSIVTDKEKRLLLNKFNNTSINFKDNDVLSLFAKQVKKHPENIAIISNNQSLTYKDLDEKSTKLASYLKSKGIFKNDIIGLMVNRSCELAIGLIAILKSGATYLPIDPEYPVDRINYMMENSFANFVLVDSKTSNLISDNYKKINVELSNTDIYNSEINFTPAKSKGKDLAYLIYTSGSTGKPKGVKINRKNLGNFVNGMKQYIDFNSSKTMISVTTICFDIFGLEFWCALCFGLKLIIANEEEQTSPELLNKLCLEYNVNIIQTTPSRYSTLFQDEKNLGFLKNISDLLVGGEPLNNKLLASIKKYSTAKIFNVYGPTETTIWSTIKDLTNDSFITVGKPIANTYIYILNPDQKLLPINVPGELYIGGFGVSDGYMNRPDLTKEHFIDSPFRKKEKIYNTSDLAYFTDTGEIVHLGRTDFQVKLRGYRVELGEIESVIEKNPNINQAIVSLKKLENNHEILVAYYTLSSSKAVQSVEDELRKSILETLPNYMLPNIFVKIEKFPYTQNGKIDRKSLPIPTNFNVEKEIIKPRNTLDQELINMLKDILETSNISISDTLISLGGDSLAAINLSTRIFAKYGVQTHIKNILSDFTIQDLSDYIEKHKTTSDNLNIIPKAEKTDFYPLSSAQRRIYFNTKMINDKNTVYNLPGCILADEILDKNKIQKIFEEIIKRHCSFRTSFVIRENNIMQKIYDKISFEINVFENEEKEINNIINNFSKPFNLEKSPLFRVELHYLNNKKTLLLFESHHIIMDGTSLNVLITEFTKLYNGEKLEALSIDYKDYAVWENKFNKSNEMLSMEKYWLEKFKDCDFSTLNLPYDYSISNNRSYKGAKISKVIEKDIFNKISDICLANDISPYMLFLSAFFILLYKYTSQTDINIGIPFANRSLNETKDMIGMFVNNIVARGKIDPLKTFKEFLIGIKNQELNDLQNGSYPFDILIKKLGINNDLSRNPLFDVMFIYQNNEETSINNWHIKEIFNNISKFNLSLEIKPSSNSINLEYRTDLFKEKTINKFFEHYINIINAVIENIDIKIGDISILSLQEKNTILYTFNNTKMEYPVSKTISELFEEQVNKTPNNIALVFENKKLTYKELNQKANQVASFLRSKGFVPNDIIGIMLPRSLELLISILGVLKSGACYIPIDPTYPEKRIDYMLNNSKAKLLITTNELYNNIDFENKISITSEEIYMQNDKNLPKVNTPEDLSYVIYTSGSTGLPKGVMLKHKNVTNLAFASNIYMDFLKDNCNYKNMLSITTVSFDIFVFETLICLQKGLKIVVANEDEQRIPALLDIVIRKNDIQLIQTTPSIMQILLDNIEDMPHLSNLQYVNLIGEPLPLHLRDNLLKLGLKKIYNEYGPTETTVFSSVSDVTKTQDIHIGKPIGNTQMYILDTNLQPVPIGVSGELYIAGDGVGKGYLYREDLTSERFIKDPFLKNNIMYKTGDLCKYNRDGDIYHLGRLDNQIKIRGLRIELEEIETKMLQFPSIKKAHVIKQSIGNREIISAYFIAEKKVKISELRSFLYRSLPKYMIPSYFTALEDFPYTPNGKIDNKSLPIPSGILQSKEFSFIAPQTELEKHLTSIWEEILNIKPIGIKDNFFELGGDSILAMNLNIRLLKITNKIKYSDIFTYPTISELAEKIESTSKEVIQNNLYEDTEKYKQLLDSNMIIPEKIIPKDVNNILLTGSTGFLGIHILAEFLKTEKGKAFLIVRKYPGQSSLDRVVDKLHYYFGTKYDKYLNKRIIPVDGDISKDGFGLNQQELFNLGNSVDIVINSAAKVSHYGNYQSFYNTNVKGVEKVIDFAKTFNKKIFHISTLSVSGNAFVDQHYIEQHFKEDIDFCENNLYIGQSLDNVYVRSKFEAEKRILDAILKGVEAHIIRVGNLMPRFSDGKFQENIAENAYINRLKAFIDLKCIPTSIENSYLEFTPIDYTASAILKIIKFSDKENIIYHIFNHNYLYLDQLLKMSSIDITIIDNNEFKKKIKSILNSSHSESLNNLINDLDKDLNFNYDSNIKIVSKHTLKLLKLYGFEWPKIEKTYIENVLKLIIGG